MTSRKPLGMTLVELLVAVAIVGILAAIAYPSYQRYVARTQRNAATACLSQYAQFMERHYSAGLTYEDPNLPADGLPCTRENELNRRYTIDLRDDPTAREYILDATPINTQATIDTECRTLTLDQAGTRSISGDGERDQCWR